MALPKSRWIVYCLATALPLLCGGVDASRTDGAVSDILPNAQYCGPDCVYVVCKMINRPVPYEEILYSMDISGSGVSMSVLVDALQQHANLESVGYELSYDQLLHKIRRFAIARMKTGSDAQAHWVVVLAIDENAVHVLSPPYGHYRIDRKQFENKWYGEVLIIDEANTFSLAPFLLLFGSAALISNRLLAARAHRKANKPTIAKPISIGSLVIATCFRADAQAVTKNDLIDVVEEYRASIHDIDFTYRGATHTLADDPNRPRFVPNFQARLKYAQDKKYVEFHQVDEQTGEKSFITNEFVAFDGQRMRKLDSTSAGQWRALIDDSMDGIRVEHNYIYQSMMWNPAAAAEDPHQAARSDLIALLSLDETHVLPETETLFDSEMVVIDANGIVRVWLDLEHGAIPRQIVWRDRTGEIVVEKHAIPQLQEAAGVFFPKTCYFEVYGTKNSPQPYQGLPTSRIEYDVDSVFVNSGLTQDDFILDFPTGTLVFDAVAEVSYAVGEPEAARTALLDAIVFDVAEDNSSAAPLLAVAERNPPSTTSTTFKSAYASYSSFLIYAFAIAAGCLIGAAAMRYKIPRRSHSDT